ncbi:MAG TPA: DUF58 domain-containing protein [Gemmatimonadales bacterium]|jgi:uncharacterized protein (DUF58 family)
MLPTRRALLLLAAAAPVALFGYATRWGLDLVLGVDLVLVVLMLIDARLASDPARLVVEREGVTSFSVGRTSEVTYRWTNPAARDALVDVREARPSVLGGPQAVRRLRLPAGEAFRETLPVVPERRGHEQDGWLALRVTGPLGLAVRQGRRDLPWNVMVYPNIPARRLKSSLAEAIRRREVGLRPLRRLGEGRMFESLREWVPGDDIRQIDWKATARRGKVIARQYEEERRQQVLLVIDAGRLVSADVQGTPRLEFVVRAALGLAFAAYHHDDNVGIMVFADTVQQYVAPQRGRRGLRQVMDVLAAVEPKLVEPDYPMAFRHLAVRNRKRALTVLFTDVIDKTASEALVANVATLHPRHLPLAVTLRNPELDAVAAMRPTDVAGAYRKAAAEELLSARDDALAQMRRAGVLVLDVAPNQASAAVVEKYVELKRRGRL